MSLLTSDGRKILIRNFFNERTDDDFLFKCAVDCVSGWVELKKEHLLSSYPMLVGSDVSYVVNEGILKGLIVRIHKNGTLSFKNFHDMYFSAEKKSEFLIANKLQQSESEIFRWDEGSVIDYLQSKTSALVIKNDKIDVIMNALPPGANVIQLRFIAMPGAILTVYVPSDVDKCPVHRRNRISKSIEYASFLLNEYVLRVDRFSKHISNGYLEYGQVYDFYLQCSDQGFPLENSCAFDVGIDDQKTCLIPDLHYFMSSGYREFCHLISFHDNTWNSKINSAFWRGSTTGYAKVNINNIVQLPRYKLCLLSNENERILDAKITNVVQCYSENHNEIMSFLSLNGVMGDNVSQLHFASYKYQVEIDGNVTPWGFVKKLMMGSCVLRVDSNRSQWFYKNIEPWVHYVPVMNDMSDLVDKIKWCLNNDDKARLIAKNGQSFARELEFEAQMTIAAKQILQAVSMSENKSE